MNADWEEGGWEEGGGGGGSTHAQSNNIICRGIVTTLYEVSRHVIQQLEWHGYGNNTV